MNASTYRRQRNALRLALREIAVEASLSAANLPIADQRHPSAVLVGRISRYVKWTLAENHSHMPSTAVIHHRMFDEQPRDER